MFRPAVAGGGSGGKPGGRPEEPPPNGQLPIQSAFSFIEAGQAMAAEVHGPEPVVVLLEPDVLPAQSLGEEQVSSLPTNLATLMDVAHLVVARILGFGQALRVGTGSCLVELARSPLPHVNWTPNFPPLSTLKIPPSG